ncbi:hypothetical protein Pcinc_026322 [Petrolisthes cinctipes]|uniref:Uncharacterized protein n=1 Tax=Petrolisthes cinctipes TaxID=88211 RepID=A0AAE1KA86_PETCI|nr:hypothetical protein Pcinc_026322 [Petrolisthes cinctipes]
MLSCGVEATGPERVRSGDPAHTTLCSDLTARAGCGKEEEERAGDRKRGYGGGWGVGREGSVVRRKREQEIGKGGMVVGGELEERVVVRRRVEETERENMVVGGELEERVKVRRR